MSNSSKANITLNFDLFATIITIVFVILKLTHTIDWSWWWVFSPILISVGLTIVGLAVMGIILLVAAIIVIIAENR